MKQPNHIACSAVRGPNATLRIFRALRVAGGAGLLAFVAVAQAVDATWNYAVEATATVAEAPPWSITLTWPEDTFSSDAYKPQHTVYRRRPDANDWGEGKVLPAGQTSFVDEAVVEGERYEYKIVREFRDPRYPQSNHDGYGYIIAGINAPVVHQRGKAILVVEERVAAQLAREVAVFRRDLVGDGWTVRQINVSADQPPAHVRDLIRTEYGAEKVAGAVVLLLGRVPIPRAGHYAPDGHESRALPADSFYGDLDGDWKDADHNGVFDENVIGSDIELPVGRIDFAEMDGIGSGKTELELMQRYLEKNHAFRQAAVRPPRRALIGDRAGIDRGRAPAATGYRAFATFFGPENVIRANTEDRAEDAERWISVLTAEPYLWAFGSGGGDHTLISFLGTRSEYRYASSSDLTAGAKGTFYLFFGSYFVDWSKPNNLMRAALAAPDYGLCAMWAGRPSLYFHHMGLGEVIGYSVRLSQNNDLMYHSPGFPTSWRRHVHVALVGDPTLRLDYVAPATELRVEKAGSAARLTWKPSVDGEKEPVAYYVYRAGSPEGPFVPLTDQPLAQREFTDQSSFDGAVYMVRAVKLQKTSSGTYYNLSQGVF